MESVCTQSKLFSVTWTEICLSHQMKVKFLFSSIFIVCYPRPLWYTPSPTYVAIRKNNTWNNWRQARHKLFINAELTAFFQNESSISLTPKLATCLTSIDHYRPLSFLFHVCFADLGVVTAAGGLTGSQVKLGNR